MNVTTKRVRVTVGGLVQTSVTYSECLSVPLVVQPAMRMRRNIYHLWPVWVYHIFPHYFINGTIFGGKESYWTQNMCFDFLYNFCLKHFSF